jgi:hypothetical protein
VSEHAEQIHGEAGSVHREPSFSASSQASLEPTPAASDIAADAEAPGLVPDQAAGAPEVHAPRVNAAKAGAPKPDAPKIDAPRTPGKLLIMSPADRDWAEDETGPQLDHEPSQSLFGKRRLGALAAVVALAVIAGAIGGAAATVGVQYLTGAEPVVAAVAPPANPALESTVARIDSDIQALKTGIEHASRTSIGQLNKTNDRLDRLEKAQAEPAAKLAKLSEAVEKLHASAPAPVASAAPPPAAAKDVTGSVSPPATTAALKTDAKPDPKMADAKPEIGRLPTVDNWILRDVDRGGALIEGRQGVFEIYAGDVIPGIGRVDAIRRQDGRWVVVTSKGLIVAR